MEKSYSMIKNIITVMLMVLVIVGVAYLIIQGTRADLPEYSSDYIKGRDAAQDLNAAIKTAEKNNKNILMIGGGNWCPWCNGMDSFFKNNPDIKDFLFDNFVLIKVYTDRRLRANQSFFKQFAKLPSTPHFYLFNKNGKFIKNYDTTPLETGPYNYSKERVLNLLKEWKNLS